MSTDQSDLSENLIKEAMEALLSGELLRRPPTEVERALAVALQEALNGLVKEARPSGAHNPGCEAYDAMDKIAIALKAAGLKANN